MTVILIAIAVAAGFLWYVASRPDSFRVERSATIGAQPDKVFALINDFHNWPMWSPWEKMDPNMKRQHTGMTRGVGAVYAWMGNSKVGEGRMEIVDSSPPSRVAIKLDFFKPFEAHNTAEFALRAADGGTHVTWAMFGPTNFMTKAMGVFGGMDKMVGKDFERGLANMKTAAEEKF